MGPNILGQEIMQPSLENAPTVFETVTPIPQEPKKRGLMLVADDAICVQKAINILANRLDIDLDVAEDGLAACRMAERSMAEGNPYDVILMDMQMPKMNGIEATRWLRQHHWQGPIVAVSVHFNDEHREQFLEAGCDAFIAKPITERKLRKAMEQRVVRNNWGEENTTNAEKTAASTDREMPSFQGRLLVAEDAKCIQMQVSSILRKMNIEVELADNGQIACEKAAQSKAEGNPYDAILMDMQMPKMNGRQAARWLREHDWQGPIIAVSMHATDRDHEEFLNSGCDDYVSKPVNESTLRNVLSQFIDAPKTT
jgi:two-component system, sensor histidine kinase and response regulator